MFIEYFWSSCGDGVIPASLAFKLYDTHGLQEEALELLATLKRKTVDWSGFRQLMAQARMKTLDQTCTYAQRTRILETFSLPDDLLTCIQLIILAYIANELIL